MGKYKHAAEGWDLMFRTHAWRSLDKSEQKLVCDVCGSKASYHTTQDGTSARAGYYYVNDYWEGLSTTNLRIDPILYTVSCKEYLLKSVME